jgi:Protein of unknown function (DUF998)
MNLAFIFAFLGFLAYLGADSVLLWLHVKPTGYHPIRHAVSDYGVGPTRRLFDVYLQLTNFGGVALAIALMAGLREPSVPQRSIILLFLLAVARIGVSWFPTDLEGKQCTRIGILHYVFAILSIGFVYTITAQLTPYFQARPDWQAVNGILKALFDIATPALMAIVITMWKPMRNFFGLFERLFIAATALWFLVVSAFLTILLH